MQKRVPLTWAFLSRFRRLGWVLLHCLFWTGYWCFKRTARTPTMSYRSLRWLHCLTDGGFNRWMSARISRKTSKVDLSPIRGVLGSELELEGEFPDALAALREDGFYVFQSRLPEDKCKELIRFAHTNPAGLIPGRPDLPACMTFDPNNPKAPRYQFDEQELLANSVLQELVADTTFQHFAQEYLEAPPINDMIAMWWSVRCGNEASSAAAQLFHFDMDRIKFLKFFIYVTDVTPRSGPHVYIKGTHRTKPATCLEDRRFTDAQVGDLNGKVIELTGPSGTIIAADTSGMHKGKVVREGARLMAQLEFTNCLFGAPYRTLDVPSEVSPALSRAMDERPTVFQRFRRSLEAAATPENTSEVPELVRA